jgi:hypothetical protein
MTEAAPIAAEPPHLSIPTVTKEDALIMQEDRGNRKNRWRDTRVLLAVLGAVGAWTRVLVDLLRH